MLVRSTWQSRAADSNNMGSVYEVNTEIATPPDFVGMARNDETAGHPNKLSNNGITTMLATVVTRTTLEDSSASLS